VAKHIDTGRDPGPFGTPAHWPILIGLAGITLGGFLAIVLGSDERSPSAVRLTRGWHAPLGGLLIFVCGSFALIGFPLDDVWHTLFGQDVTLWGPTHILMVAGASLSTLGLWVLVIEGARARSRAGAPSPARMQSFMIRSQEALLGGAFLIGLSTLQGEFDYGVPQFQLVYQPILIALATGVALVTARVRLGRGGALMAATFYVAVFGLLSLIIHQGLGLTMLHFPLYLPEALLVELAAWGLTRGGRALSPVKLGLAGGVLIGTLGLAAEWGWSQLWMPLPWPTSVLPEAAVLGLLAALAGGALGGFIGQALDRQRGDSAASVSRGWMAGLAGALAVACIVYPLPMNTGAPMSATAQLSTVNGGAQRTVNASFHLSPANAAADASWVTVTAWQGGGLVVERLRRTAPNTYVTTHPIPVYGNWKTMLRIANGRALDAIPIYLPNDPAIPAHEVAASASFTRTFVRDKKILQREAVGGDLWLAIPAYLLLLAIAAVWMAALTWGLRRLGARGSEGPPAERPRPLASVMARTTA
jgi:hypothetical protein